MSSRNPNPKYLQWTCKCKNSYALEFNAPKPHRCKKVVGYDNRDRPIICGAEFPDQTQRNLLQAAQFGAIIPP